MEGRTAVYETVVHSELEGLSSEFALFVLDVVAAQGSLRPQQRQPIIYLSHKDFATLGETWRYR